MIAVSRTLFCAFWLWLACGLIAQADEPQARIAIESAHLEVGQPIELQVQISGSNRGGRPPEIKVDGLDVQYRHQSEETQMGFVNGSFSRSTLYIHSYQVTARRAGTFPIPPLAVEVDGQTLHTQAITLRAAGSDDPANKLDTGRAEVEVKKRVAYIGESVPVELRLLVDARIPPSQWTLDSLPELAGEGFTKTPYSYSRSGDREQISRGDRDYYAMVIHTTLTPSRAGKISVGPASFEYRAVVPRAQAHRSNSGQFNDFFNNPVFGMGDGALQHLTAASESVMLEVKPLPLAGQPASFSGAVGKFQMAVQYSPGRVKIGDPITAKMKVTGKGNRDRVGAPVLADTTGWHAYDATSSPIKKDDDPLEVDKSFEVAVVPETKHTQMPVFEFSYFDPEQGRYVTLKSDPKPLIVEGEAPPPPPVPKAAAALDAPTAPPASVQAPAPTDILSIRYDYGTPHSFRPLYRERGFLLAQGVPAVLLLGWLIARSWRPDHGARAQAALRRQRASLLSQMRRERNRAAFYEAAARAVQIEVALQTGQSPEAIDAGTVRRKIEPGSKHAAAIEEIFEHQANALYSGTGAASEGDIPAAERERAIAAVNAFGRKSRREPAPVAAGVALLCFFLPLAAHAAPVGFDKGNQLYDHTIYAEAVKEYATVPPDQVSANLAYNAGNAEFRLNHPGRAILGYERALVLEPSHPEAIANLALVRSKTGALLIEPTSLDRFIPPWPAAVFPVLASVAAWVALFSMVGLLLKGRAANGLVWLSFFVALALGAWAGVVILGQNADRALAIVLETEATARTAPADRAASVEPLPAGSQVRVLSERGEWTYRELPGSRRGWLPTTSIEKLLRDT